MGKSIINEINGRYIEAVNEYSAGIEMDDGSVKPDCFINLSFLYWSFAFELFEFVIPNGISDYWSNVGGERFLEILDLGLRKFPDNIELHFWRKYFLHISYGKEFSENECLSLIEKYYTDKNIVPYFYLYLFDKDKYKVQKSDLIKLCEKFPTAKNLYIKSILV